MVRPTGLEDFGQVLDAVNLDVAMKPQSRGEIIQSSLDRDIMPPVLLAHRNGLVIAVISAYSLNHRLIIQPEDIWLVIIS